MSVKPIIRSEGTTRSERILAKLGEASFLNLWTYPSPYRDQKLGGKGDGKELCDLLVVCGDDVIIFSDKEIQWSDKAEPNVAWGRWYRSAVGDSVKQIRGASSWLRKFPDRVFLDKVCEIPLPIRLPPPDRMRVHGVVIATGAEDACHRIGGNKDGRLRLSSNVKGADHIATGSAGFQPFVIGDPDPSGPFVHVFDRPGMLAVLTLMDTISDFTRYLRKREEAFRKDVILFAHGEDDLIAYYVSDIGPDGDHDFIRSDRPQQIGLLDGIAEQIKLMPAFQARREADRISYLWDTLITQFSTPLLAGTTADIVGRRMPVADTEEALRVMARETRFRRRVLGNLIVEAYDNILKRGADRHARVIMPTEEDGEDSNAYVFLIFADKDDVFGGDLDAYRQARIAYLVLYARAILAQNRYLGSVTCIGVDAPPELTGKTGGSEDVVTHQQIDWSDDELEQLHQQQKEFGVFPNYAGGGRKQSEQEYPTTYAIRRQTGESRQQRRARERAERKRQRRR